MYNQGVGSTYLPDGRQAGPGSTLVAILVITSTNDSNHRH